MVEVISEIFQGLISIYEAIFSSLPLFAQNFVSVFLLVILIVLYAVFIWKFYQFVSKKNIIGLNLKQYNRYDNPVLTKIAAIVLYLIEYFLILPFLIFFWFAVFTIFLILLSKGLSVKTILLISATIIASIRMTSYYKQELSRELAKMLPFTLLAVSLLEPGFFNVENTIQLFVGISSYFGEIVNYLVFIIGLEIILRLFDSVFYLFGINKD